MSANTSPLRIQRHDGAGGVAERVFRRLLGRQIDRQDDVLSAGRRRGCTQLRRVRALALHGPPLRIDQDLSIAVLRCRGFSNEASTPNLPISAVPA